MGELGFALFGPGDRVTVTMRTVMLGHCGHHYAFEGGYECVLQPEETLEITMSRIRKGKREYAVNAPDTDGVTRVVWLDESDIAPPK